MPDTGLNVRMIANSPGAMAAFSRSGSATSLGELLPRSMPRGSRAELLPRPITWLWRPTVKRHPKERNLCAHAVQIGHRQHPKEPPSPTCKHLRHLLSAIGTQ